MTRYRLTLLGLDMGEFEASSPEEAIYERSTEIIPEWEATPLEDTFEWSCGKTVIIAAHLSYPAFRKRYYGHMVDCTKAQEHECMEAYTAYEQNGKTEIIIRRQP